MQTLQRRRAAPTRVTKSPELRMDGGGHDFAFPKLGGGEIDLRAFAGRPILVVNVASACGFTPQYRELQALWDAKKDAGLVIIGVPSNDFGAQEPGDEKTIETFCADQYHVTFPMTGKIDITGQNRHPFYQWIAKELGLDALPRWNFHKFLIGKDGALIEAFNAKATPLGPQMLGAIKEALTS
jgi:glutathione peroxidase